MTPNLSSSPNSVFWVNRGIMGGKQLGQEDNRVIWPELGPKPLEQVSRARGSFQF